MGVLGYSRKEKVCNRQPHYSNISGGANKYGTEEREFQEQSPEGVRGKALNPDGSLLLILI